MFSQPVADEQAEGGQVNNGLGYLATSQEVKATHCNYTLWSIPHLNDTT